MPIKYQLGLLIRKKITTKKLKPHKTRPELVPSSAAVLVIYSCVLSDWLVAMP